MKHQRKTIKMCWSSLRHFSCPPPATAQFDNSAQCKILSNSVQLYRQIVKNQSIVIIIINKFLANKKDIMITLRIHQKQDRNSQKLTRCSAAAADRARGSNQKPLALPQYTNLKSFTNLSLLSFMQQFLSWDQQTKCSL